MIALRRIVFVVLFSVVGCQHGRQASAEHEANRIDVPPRELATMIRHGCFGDCPAYTVTLYEDGRVLFGRNNYGRRKFASEGADGEAHASPDAVARIRLLMARLEGLNQKDLDCRNRWTDDTAATITFLSRDGEQRTIEHDHGCEGPPEWLFDVENELDSILGTERWVGRKVEYHQFHPKDTQ